MDEFLVGENHFSGPEQILQGFKIHFENLAKKTNINDYDEAYHKICTNEVQHIQHIVTQNDIKEVIKGELLEVIRLINKGKSPNIYNLTIEHILYAEDSILKIILEMCNQIFKTGEVPNMLKRGLLTPIFKNKGSKKVSTYYRGITILPVMNKIIEAIIKLRINTTILDTQNPAQR